MYIYKSRNISNLVFQQFNYEFLFLFVDNYDNRNNQRQNYDNQRNNNGYNNYDNQRNNNYRDNNRMNDNRDNNNQRMNNGYNNNNNQRMSNNNGYRQNGDCKP